MIFTCYLFLLLEFMYVHMEINDQFTVMQNCEITTEVSEIFTRTNTKRNEI